MLIILLIVISVLVAVLAAPKSVRDNFIQKNFDGSKRHFRLVVALTLVFVVSLLSIFAFARDYSNHVPAAGGAIAFGILASTSLAGIVFVQTRPVDKQPELKSE